MGFFPSQTNGLNKILQKPSGMTKDQKHPYYGAFHLSNVFVDPGFEAVRKQEHAQRDWTFVCDGKKPGFDGKTRLK